LRIILVVLLLGAFITGALLWNKKNFAPIEKTEDSQIQINRKIKNIWDEMVVVIGGMKAKQIWESQHSKIFKKPKPKHSKKDYKPKPAVRKVILHKGDTLYSIAKKILGSGMRYKEILKLNNLTEEEAKKLPVGSVVVIPSN